MGRNFYCADPHFYHAAILTSPSRSMFSSVTEMNRALVLNHNQKVTEDDTTYFLGDIIFCQKQYLEMYLSSTLGKMVGHKVLVVGNHDYRFLKSEIFRSYFETIRENMVIRDGGENIHLCHYPMYSWWNKHRGVKHFYGHSHMTLEGMAPNSFCVSDDVIDLTPRTKLEIVMPTSEQ